MTLHLMRSSHAYSGMRDLFAYFTLLSSHNGSEVQP